MAMLSPVVVVAVVLHKEIILAFVVVLAAFSDVALAWQEQRGGGRRRRGGRCLSRGERQFFWQAFFSRQGAPPSHQTATHTCFIREAGDELIITVLIQIVVEPALCVRSCGVWPGLRGGGV